MDVIAFHQQDPNGKRRRVIATWLRLFAESKILRAGDELTDDKLRSYDFELRHIPLDALEKGFLAASIDCRFFPAAVEIRERCPAATPDEHRAVQKARERSLRGEQVPQWKSVLDEKQNIRLLVGDVLSRKELLRLGLEEPRQLTPYEWELSYQEQKRQAEKLLRAAQDGDSRRRVAVLDYEAGILGGLS